MKKKILLFGGSGMVGREVLRHFKKNRFTIISPTHSDVDITDRKAVVRAIHGHNSDIIINAAAIINVDACEANPIMAYAVNTLGPLFIADALVSLGKKKTIFVHYSSSDIFGTDFAIASAENNKLPKPVNIYGQSKYYGEKSIANTLDGKKFPLYIIRSSWVFSEFKQTFVDVVAKHVKQPVGILNIVHDQRGVPTSGKALAANTQKLIEGHYPYGSYHFVSEIHGREATRWEVAQEIAHFFGHKDTDRLFCAMSQREVFKTLRPASSAIINTRFPKFPYWREALQAYLKEKYL